jgi:hypothetical protein
MLEKITYSKLAEQTANDAENLQKTVSKVPQNIFVG